MATHLHANSMYIVYQSTQIVNTWSNPTHAAVDLLNDFGEPYYSATSTGPITVKFKTPNNGGKWTINAGGEFRVLGNWNGSNGLNTTLALDNWGPCLGVSGLGPAGQISISIVEDIMGPVSAQSMFTGGILAVNLQSSGALTLYADTGNNIALNNAIAGNVTCWGNMTGNITAGSSITGTIRVYGSMSGRVSAPSITGTLILADFTGTIEANGLTPSTIPSGWQINEPARCGFYVKDLSTGNPAEYVQCLSFDVPGSPVTVPEGGSSSFVVKLDSEPLNPVSVTVSHYSGDPDITVTGPTMPFALDNTNWNTGVTVTLSAATDADAEDGQATIKVEAVGVPNAFVTAKEDDSNIGFLN